VSLTRIESVAGRVEAGVLSDGPRAATPTVVNAAGPWAGEVAALAGLAGAGQSGCDQQGMSNLVFPSLSHG